MSSVRDVRRTAEARVATAHAISDGATDVRTCDKCRKGPPRESVQSSSWNDDQRAVGVEHRCRQQGCLQSLTRDANRLASRLLSCHRALRSIESMQRELDRVDVRLERIDRPEIVHLGSAVSNGDRPELHPRCCRIRSRRGRRRHETHHPSTERARARTLSSGGCAREFDVRYRVAATRGPDRRGPRRPSHVLAGRPSATR